jgi:hypothetical protein
MTLMTLTDDGWIVLYCIVLYCLGEGLISHWNKRNANLTMTNRQVTEKKKRRRRRFDCCRVRTFGIAK